LTCQAWLPPPGLKGGKGISYPQARKKSSIGPVRERKVHQIGDFVYFGEFDTCRFMVFTVMVKSHFSRRKE
jgi:hypothetical protein